MGVYAILALAAWLTLEESRIRLAALVVIGGVAAKTAIAWLARER
jgi:hypothetical protein